MRTLAALVVALALTGGAGAATQKSPPGVVKVATNSTLNQAILVDGTGRTLYMYDGDFKNISTCTDFQCVKAWPALVAAAKGKVKPGAGVNAKLLKVAKQKDGRMQLMYAGHLLYTWAGGNNIPGDKPGDVTGMGIGSAWWPLSATGQPIKTKP
jgi:predicted lipoprotein with Yx(FWY)xxD motif